MSYHIRIATSLNIKGSQIRVLALSVPPNPNHKTPCPNYVKSRVKIDSQTTIFKTIIQNDKN